jgi:membrane protein DedA with SNARE-associated domain
MLEEYLQPLLDWIHIYPTWTGVIVCLISFSESLVGLGFFVPGILLMTSIGALVGHGILPLWETLGWAILGAVGGDGVSFWIGHRYQAHLREFWPFRKYPQWLKRGQTFFEEHGGKSIILGRFLGPVRPIIPVIAGIMHMPPYRFYLYNFLSALVWAPLYSLPGYLFGLSLGVLNADISKRLIIIIIALALGIWLCYTVLYFLLKKGSALFEYFLKRCLTWGLEGIADLRHAGAMGQLRKQMVWFILLLLWLGLYSDRTTLFWEIGDNAVWQISESFQVEPWLGYARLFSLGGDPWVLGMGFLSGLLLLLCYRCFPTVLWLLSLFAGAVLVQGFLGAWTDYGFMRANTVWITTAFLGLALRLGRDWPMKQVPLWQSIGGLYSLILFSQLYLGLYPISDGILGVLMSAWMVVSIEMVYCWRVAKPWYGSQWKPFVGWGFCLVVITIVFVILSLRDIFPSVESFYDTQKTVETVTLTAWEKGHIDGLGLRHNFWGKPLLDLNVESAASEDLLQNRLIATGWVILQPTTFLRSLEWLSPVPKPMICPDIPHFNHHQRPSLIMVKESSFGRYVLRLWPSNHLLGERQQAPIFVGTVLAQSFQRVWPFVHVYTTVPRYEEALNELQNDLKGHSLHLSLQEIPQESYYHVDEGWDWHMLFIN